MNRAWSTEHEKQLVDLYLNQNVTDVQVLAEIFDKGRRSVISKLVQLKIYIKPKDLEEPKGKTVKMMLREIEEMLDIEVDGININKKENLVKLVDALNKKLK